MKAVHKPVVLVIDDEQTYLNIITQTLKERNYKILQALDGKMGIMVAKKFIPNIIITDWEMPEKNGIETIIELKQDELTKDIPIIMCTGIMTSSKNLDMALNAGAIDYIRKPVEPMEIISRINSALSIADAMKEIKIRNEQIEEQKIQIEQKNKKLEHLNATKDKFFSIIGHDLKNPLHIIYGFSNMLLTKLEKSDFDRLEEFLGHISNTASGAFKLLENLLDWARMQRGDLKPQLSNYNLKNLTDEVHVLLKEVATAKNIRLKNEIGESCIAFCDKEMTKTILRNLISNAIKYSNENAEVKVKLKKEEEFIEISVIDNGVGIDEDKINDLFKIDKNVSTPGTADERGTGLGLILCKELAEKQGGEIKIESELGKGSVFRFTLKKDS